MSAPAGKLTGRVALAAFRFAIPRAAPFETKVMLPVGMVVEAEDDRCAVSVMGWKAFAGLRDEASVSVTGIALMVTGTMLQGLA